MERLNQESAPNKGKLNINIVRHGPSSYKQPQWEDINTADDLNSLGQYDKQEKNEEEVAKGKKEAVEIVKKTAEKIAVEIKPDEEVVIWSSPAGRTLETAGIISEILRKKNIKLRNAEEAGACGVKIFKQVGEVKKFSWNLFKCLVKGGEMEHSGIKFNIDKSATNPLDLDYAEYFASDSIKKIPPEIKSLWPKDYVAEIESFESFSEATERMILALKRLSKIGDKNYRIIIVTHEALSGYLVKTFTNDELSGIDPGQLISLERKDDKLVVTRVGDITEVNDKKDVLE